MGEGGGSGKRLVHPVTGVCSGGTVPVCVLRQWWVQQCARVAGLPESRALFEYAPMWVELIKPSGKRTLAAAEHAVFPRPAGMLLHACAWCAVGVAASCCCTASLPKMCAASCCC